MPISRQGSDVAFGLVPDFLFPLANLTVPQGRDAIFTCVVNNLGGYRGVGLTPTGRSQIWRSGHEDQSICLEIFFGDNKLSITV
ncbi:hypothetical protein HUJ05_002944 [Dendroctonus ponderosae]|nr:hypothetical protein HUJ05_002944 [Dendroctonus ponderosae]